MARIHHIDGWMKKYKEMGDKKNILESDNRIQFLRAVADTDQDKIDLVNDYMHRVEGLGHFFAVSPNDETLAKYTKELKAIQENYAREKQAKRTRMSNRLAYERFMKRKESKVTKSNPIKKDKRKGYLIVDKKELQKLIISSERPLTHLSKEMGFSHAGLSNIISSKASRVKSVKKIAAYFNVPVERITL